MYTFLYIIKNAIMTVINADDQAMNNNEESTSHITIDMNSEDDSNITHHSNTLGGCYTYTMNYDNKIQWARINGKDVYESCKKLISKSPLPEGIEFMSPSIVINMFAINDTKKLLADLLNGIEKLEKKGIRKYILIYR